MANTNEMKKQDDRLPGQILAQDGRVLVLKMSVEDWIKTPDHPRQRDTVRHARASHWREAMEAKGAIEAHLHHVTGAVLDGKLYKVDGHTRAYLWKTGELKCPREVIVTAYRVQGRHELLELYKTMDASSAANTPRDKVLGAFREHGFVPVSQLLGHGFLTDALHIALRGVPRSKRSRVLRAFDVYKAVGLFLPEITRLDRLEPNPEIFKSGITAAALILFCLDRDADRRPDRDLDEFFTLLSQKKGEKRAGRMDPVEAVLTVISDFKSQKYRRPPLAQVEMCGRCIRAALGWMKGNRNVMDLKEDKNIILYWRGNRPAPVDVLEYVDKVRAIKNVGDDPTL